MRALRPDFLEVPLPRRYSAKQHAFTEGMARHAEAVRDGVPAYQDPVSGFMVFTARFLADREYCCDSGCRHCPYEPH